MKQLHALFFSLIIAAPVSGLAQAGRPADGGILGQRFIELRAGGIAADRSSGTGWIEGVRLSVPMLSHTDISVGYENRDRRTEALLSSYRLKQEGDAANLDVTQAFEAIAIKPFVTAGLGYRSIKRHLTFLGYTASNVRDHEGEWRLGVGAEIPCSRVILTPAIRYYQGITKKGDFEEGQIANAHPRGLRSSVEALFWLTPSVGAFASLEYDRPNNEFHYGVPVVYPAVYPFPVGPAYEDQYLGSENAAWIYQAGLRVRF